MASAYSIGASDVWRVGHFSAAFACSTLVTAGPLATGSAAAKTTTVSFHYDGITGTDGFPQLWVVPRHVFQATFSAFGAQGGGERGGLGGTATATLAVKPGEVLAINVGGRPSFQPFRSFGGFNGGGPGATGTGHPGETESGDGSYAGPTTAPRSLPTP